MSAVDPQCASSHQARPKHSFDAEIARRVLGTLRTMMDAEIACEPRNAAWFGEDADAMLREMRIARVAADPALGPAAPSPEGWLGLPNWRLHGSPGMYRSSYGDEAIDIYAAQIQSAIDEGLEPWCMFDNTAAGEATGNALSLMAKLNRERTGEA